ncbi:MAG TPA: FG-GAP-like repeat-containing protein [Pyrinomonadaceae bacterium]|nr:FG-GAP-like repeat-containing protein [Pyrinomonadaceae bacterium]
MRPPSATALLHRLSAPTISFFFIVATALLSAFVGWFSVTSAGTNSTQNPSASIASKNVSDNAASNYGKLPLSFARNEGQTERRVRFISRGFGYSLFLTADEAVFALRSGATGSAVGTGSKARSPEALPEALSSGAVDVVRMKLVGANGKARVVGLEESPGKLNYFIGNDARKWRRNISTYAQVKYRNAYPGIDLVYHGNQQQLEYDFVVAPGASPQRIKLAFAGMERIAVDATGDLLLTTPSGILRQHKPVAYQEIEGERREVAANYRLRGNAVSFEIGVYEKSRPLVIDPVLIYSTFLGGSGSEQGLGIALDAQGSAYLTGNTSSIDFPLAGAPQNVNGGFNDAFVVKLNPAGTALVYSTYLGGNGDDVANAIAVDASGSAYVVGFTGSGSFPRTVGAFQNSKDGAVDGFVSKLSPDGSSLAYSTFLGGDNSDTAYGVAVDAAGAAYVTGRTDSTRFSFFIPLQRNGNPAYKSANGGGLWAGSSQGLTASSVSNFALDPATSSTIYAASNYGVFKSISAGANWSLTGAARTSTAPPLSNAVVVDPSNPNIVYAAAVNGVYKSTDGGSLYDIKNIGFGVPVIQALAIDQNTPTTLYAGTIFGIFKTTNGGDLWTEMRGGITSSPRVNEVVIDPSNSSIVYMGTNSGFFKTTNGGTLWTRLTSGPMAGLQISALAIDPLNPATLYAGAPFGSEILYKSVDGGATWAASGAGLSFLFGAQIVKPAINTLAVDPVNPATLYAATSGGGIFKSIDSGASWTQSNNGITNMTALGVIVDRTTPATVYAGVTIANDAFAVKLNSAGSAPEYLTSFGGSENDEARGIALDADGNAYIVGSTSSTDFPVLNAFQSTYGNSTDAFVTKLNNTGSAFVYSSFLGGRASEQGRAIAVRSGSAYVVGSTNSDNFPLINPVGPAPINFDTNAFVTKVNASGASLDFSGCLGGEGFDQGLGVALDSSGAVYVAGATISSTFPIVDAPQPSAGGVTDAFVSKLNATGNALVYSTFVGGLSNDSANAIAVSSSGNAYIIGTTSSSNFPTFSAYQSTLKGTDAFVTKIGVAADLSVTKADSRDPVMVGNPLTYTIRVTNNGPSSATGVTVTDALPSQLTFVSATPSQGSCAFNSGTVTCAIGNLSASAVAVIAISVTPTTANTISNTATVTANEADDIPANNSATESTKVSTAPSINGRVTDGGGNGVSGVLMTLSGTQSSTTQTDANGNYQFPELQLGGSFTVTPSNANFSFNPAAETFNPLNSDRSANFVATPCSYTISPGVQSFNAGGGTGSVNVTTLQGCPWTAVSSSDWITITSGGSGVGNGTVNFSVSVADAPRAGQITIAGQTFVVYQEFDSCGVPSFSIANYNLGTVLTMTRVADLNGDGRLDIVEGNGGTSSGGAVILLNNASGQFTPASLDTGISFLDGLAIADFNGDNRPDIAVTNFNAPFLRIFLNNGSGGFGQSKIDAPLGAQVTQGLFASDLNNDGKADLLVSAFNQNFVQVLLGNGTGGFTQTNVTLGSNIHVVGTADFNHDTIPDLLLSTSSSSQPMAVKLGTGTGAFGPSIGATGIVGINAPVTGDFNGDGHLDVAAGGGTLVAPSTVDPGIVVMLGDGAGHFTRKTTFSVPQVAGMTAADFNADGKLDVAFTRGDNRVTILPGDGAGAFGTPLELTTVTDNFGPGNNSIVAADLVGDAKPDLAVANYSYASSVLRNTCAGAPFISGRITDSRTTIGLEGVAITLGPLQVINTHTDAGGNYFIGNLSAGGTYDVIPSKANFKFNPTSIHIDNLTGNRTANFVGTPTTVQFSPAHYVAQENGGSIEVKVTRAGDLSAVTTVDYRTVNVTASDRSDFTPAVGTLRFNPGEALKSINLLLTNDALVEGWESVKVVLSNPQGAIFNTPMTGGGFEALVEIQDNDSNPAGPNPISESQFFVRQHYLDFFSREPDAGGLQFWVNEIEACGANAQCREVKRINVSAAFFLSIEFQETGYLAYRMYNSAYGETTSPNVEGTVPIIRLQEFLPDTQRIGFGIQVGIGNWQQQLEENKTAYALEFVQRPRFITAFPHTMTAAEFVAKLDQNTNGALSANEKAQLIDFLIPTPADAQRRASVLRMVAEDSDLRQRELSRAFVLMQFYGYLRRNPDDPQDTDFRGWKFWLDKLNQFNGNFVNAEMVKAFLDSGEYRQRFGMP